MAAKFPFAEEEMAVDQGLGYPKAYAKLCRNPHLHNPYNQGPPFIYNPYILHDQEALRAKDLNQLFPITDPEKTPSTNPRHYASLLWKQLNHLGNAGFDPANFRIDPYGNVVYFFADSGSPLAWEIDHWFPCSRGGKTVPSNLRILQLQVCKKKDDKLEFLIPWWDLQLGVSVNQFLLIFTSANLDFRNRAFSWLFLEGENEELNNSQVAESHSFPQHFLETQLKVGPAPAAIVFSRRDRDTSTLRSIDLNRDWRSNSPAIGKRQFSIEEDESFSKALQQYRPGTPNGNENSDMGNNQYLVIAKARDSLIGRHAVERKLSEIHKFEDELNELKQRNEVDRLALQDLELTLMKRRRRTEKCRRLAEAQSSYKASLEKMIRDTMHQSIVYKEQIRLARAANSALTARLEAQKALCDSSKNELQRRLKQREEIENEIKPYCEQARKRSRLDDTLCEESYENNLQLIPGTTSWKPLQKELRLFLEEEQKVSHGSLSLLVEGEQEEKQDKPEPKNAEKLEEIRLDEALQKLVIRDRNYGRTSEEKKARSLPQSPKREDEEDHKKKIGKGNVDKWLQILLDNTKEDNSSSEPSSPKPDEHERNKAEETGQKVLLENHGKNMKFLRLQTSEDKEGNSNQETVEAGGKKMEKSNISEGRNVHKGSVSRKSFEGRGEKSEKKGLARCESARVFRPTPSSPSVILGMRRGVDCIGKKPMVTGDDEEEADTISQVIMMNNKSVKTSIKTCTRAIKKAVRK